MWRIMVGTLLGIYLAQTYKLPNVHDKIRELNEYVKANKILEEKEK